MRLPGPQERIHLLLPHRTPTKRHPTARMVPYSGLPGRREMHTNQNRENRHGSHHPYQRPGTRTMRHTIRRTNIQRTHKTNGQQPPETLAQISRHRQIHNFPHEAVFPGNFRTDIAPTISSLELEHSNQRKSASVISVAPFASITIESSRISTATRTMTLNASFKTSERHLVSTSPKT